MSSESSRNRLTPPIETVRMRLLALTEPGNAQSAGGSVSQADAPGSWAQGAASGET